MDDYYHSIHGHDVANFGTPNRADADRVGAGAGVGVGVVTVSAADLLSRSPASSTTSDAPAPPSSRFIATGIATLDAILAGLPLPPAPADRRPAPAPSRSDGGVRRGQLTEIWGPPGSGKSTFGMQIAASALRDGCSVTWIDCFQPLCEDRLATIVEHQLHRADADTNAGADAGADADVQDRFTRYACPSLAHFIALLCPPPPARPPCVPDGTALLVIDSLSALVNYALPRAADRKGAPLMANGRRGPTAYDKRTQVIQYVTAALERLAETRRIAIVVLTQCATRMQAERGASLAPSLSADVWNRGIAARIVLFRDWAWHEREGRPVGGRFAGIQRLNGHTSDAGIDAIVAFDIVDAGLVEEPHYTVISPQWLRTMHHRRKNLKLGDAAERGGGGHALSSHARRPEDEDYGWDDELTDSLPQMPPQWQGSEDIMLGPPYDEEEEEEEEEEGGDEEEEVKSAVGGGAEALMQRIPRRRSQSVADSEADSDL